VTHRLDEVFRVADRVTVLRDGRVRSSRPTSETTPRGLGEDIVGRSIDEIFAIADRVTVLRDGRVVGTAPVGEMSRRRLISMMVGRDLEVLYPKTEVAIGSELLSVEHLCYTQGRDRILEDVSLTVRRGEIVGIAGLMGAGRTQVLEAIFGVYPRSSLSGTIRLEGRPVAFASPADAIDSGLGLVAEDRKQQSLVLERSVTENVTLASLERFVNRIRIIDQRAERTAVRGIVSDLGVRTPTIDTLITNLSGGNQQKVVIGRFLLSRIVLFLMDEPTRGIDVGAKAEIHALMGRLAGEGTGFLLVSSEMPELLAVCDRIYVLCEGRVTAELARGEFDQETIMEAATRFTDKVGGAAVDAA
jgi:ABC-type sugar transport system ATPase subunit